MPDLERDRLADRGGDRQHAGPLGDPVAEHHLGGHRRRPQPEGGHDLGLDGRIDVGVGADHPGQLAYRDRVTGPQQPVPAAGHREREVGHPVTPDVGLGVNAVRPPGPQRAAVRERVVAQHRHQRAGLGQQQVGRLGELDGQGRVEQVRRGHAEVHVRGRRTR